MKLSILTATYNRAKCLEKLYESIIQNHVDCQIQLNSEIQSNNKKDTNSIKQSKSIIENDKLKNNIIKNNNLEIEWIIIDDGSTDGTKSVVEQFISKNKIINSQNSKTNNKINNNKNNKISNEINNNKINEISNEINSKIDIKYFYQQNSGKMAAINKAVEYATGDLIIDCDSDDIFSKDAFNKILQNSSRLFENNQLYALCFLKKDLAGKISGKEFPTNYMQSTMFDLYFKHNIEGEKILVFNSKIRKKYKHELENGEKFVTEARMYHKMDEKYKILCVNKAIEIGEYKEDGYTKNILETFKKYPNGYYKYFKEILKKDLNGVLLKKKIYVLKHFLFFLGLKQFYNIKSKESRKGK